RGQRGCERRRVRQRARGRWRHRRQAIAGDVVHRGAGGAPAGGANVRERPTHIESVLVDGESADDGIHAVTQVPPEAAIPPGDAEDGCIEDEAVTGTAAADDAEGAADVEGAHTDREGLT